ncbi:MAG TPA: hypothetical protein VLX31_17815 [Streptosporangiaceae bacterium]|nr:hypothetical protein [Streptosporangiaceae bacterium]
MPQLSDFLNRFRPVGAPGAAGRAGVPADRAAELAAELRPVLELLDSTQEQCVQVVAQARQEAGRIIARARREAERIAADGRNRAQAARGDATARVLESARTRAAAQGQAAARSAAGRPGPADDDVRALVRTAVDLVRAIPGEAVR